VTTVDVLTSVLNLTHQVLRAYGEKYSEGFVLWLGRWEGNRAQVCEHYVPKQTTLRSDDGVGYFVDSAALFNLNRYLSSTGLRLLAQVHSHPGRAYHSGTDDRYAVVTTEGGLSVVVPDFARWPLVLARCAVYRLIDRQWCELSGSEVTGLFNVIEDFYP
jgi:hypothetical protein